MALVASSRGRHRGVETRTMDSMVFRRIALLGLEGQGVLADSG